MRTNILWLMLVLLLAGCAATPNNTAKEPPVQQAPIAVAPDLSAAIAALKDGKPIVAEALLRGLAQRYPQAGAPWVNIGLIMFRRGEWDRAQQAAERALALEPEIAVADYLLGMVAHQRNDAPLALKHYTTALEKVPQHAHSHYNLALLYDTFYQDIEKAVHHYYRYLALITDEDEATLAWVKELEAQLAPEEGADEG